MACGCLGGSERVGLPAIVRVVLLAVAGPGFGAAAGMLPGTDFTTSLLLPIAAMIAGLLVFMVSLADAVTRHPSR